MNINYHYNTIKIIAIYSEFTQEEAEYIAYASQYVDDAVEHKFINVKHIDTKEIKFATSEGINPTCTAQSGI